MDILKHTDLAELRKKQEAVAELSNLKDKQKSAKAPLNIQDLLARIEKIETILGIE